MAKYKMELTPEQQAVLDGREGETKAKVMETLVMFGDIFGATKLVPVTHKQGHLVTSFGIGLLKPLFSTMDKLIAAGLKAEGGFSVDPRPLDYANVKCNPLEKLVFNKILYSKQEMYENQMRKVGLTAAASLPAPAISMRWATCRKRETCCPGRNRARSCTLTRCSARAATATAACSTCSAPSSVMCLTSGF